MGDSGNFFQHFFDFSSLDALLSSGGGFYVEFRGLWTLKGIVSSAAVSSATGECDVERYTLFTNVADFANWIQQEIKANP